MANLVGNPYDRVRVIEACYNVLESIRVDRADALAELLKPLLKERYKYWFFGPTVTRSYQSALDSLDQWDMYGVEGLCENQRQTTKQILDAAIYAQSETVNLSVREFAAISRAYENVTKGRRRA